MATEATNDLIANYWAPVSQIAPVFALALVLEARRLATTWTIENRLERSFYSAILLVTACLIYTLESWSLSAMSTGESDPVRVQFSNLLIFSVMTGLAVQPVLSLAIAGNAEIFARAARLFPGSPYNKTWKTMKKTEANLILLSAEVIKAEATAVENVKRLRLTRDKMRQNLANLDAVLDDLRSQSDEESVAEGITSALEASGLAREDLVEKLKGADFELQKAKKFRKKMRRTLLDVDKFVTDVDTEAAKLKSGKMTDFELARIKNLIDARTGRNTP